MIQVTTGYADINNAKIYFEQAGDGIPFVMIHAGIANCHMWDNEFEYFSNDYQVMRYDIRGYGKSKPVDGKWNVQDDFVALLDSLAIDEPIILMGCSIGAGLAIDYALTFPDSIKSLILVGGVPRGFDGDTSALEPLWKQAEQAFEAGNLDLVTEIDMQIWLDGFGRETVIDPEVRQHAYDMNRIVIEYEAQELGEHITTAFDKPANERLDELSMEVLIIVGDKDAQYILDAADYMAQTLPNAYKVTIQNAAHLPNLEFPIQFRNAVEQFLIHS